MYDEYIITDQDKLRRIEEALRSTYFLTYDPDFLKTEVGRDDINANVYGRYNDALKHVVPWVAEHIDLQGKRLVEVGCGTGASTAAFAHFVADITGYDIDARAVEGARARMEVMEFDNVDLHVIQPEELVPSLRNRLGDGVDIILLFAVLEHQTIEERHETIKLCWEMLNDDGLLVVTETPNLLHYTDLHTSQLPFLHLLPTKLYARYADRSPREGFGAFFAESDLTSEQLDTAIMRWGRGVSYHDFELSMGKDYGNYLVADGFEEEMLTWFKVSLEEELLRYFFTTTGLEVPLAFSRVVLNVIFKKNNALPAGNSKIPKNKFVADMQTVTEQEMYINTLQDRLAAAEQQLHEVLSSRRWRMSNFVAAPYRKLKSFFRNS